VNDDTQPVKRWGYWATLGWAILAYGLGQVAATVLVIAWEGGDLSTLMATPYDGKLVALSVLALNPISVAVLLIAVRLAKANPVDYLALVVPRARQVMPAILCLIGLIAASDLALYLSGSALITPFQSQSYTTATAEGWLPVLWIAAVIVAPAGEELLFRGFIFRGIVRPGWTAWLGIVGTAVLFALPHVQYDLIGMAQIFVVGLFLGWARLTWGSVLMTFLLHALFNLEGMMETVLAIKFFS
jgi:hypothetical protein